MGCGWGPPPAMGCGAALAGWRTAKVYRRLGVAFGTTVSVSVEAASAAAAETAFAAAFAEIRHVDRVASLTREDGDLFRLNRDGRLDERTTERPEPAGDDDDFGRHARLPEIEMAE